MQPANGLNDVRRLAKSEETCEFFKPVLDELFRHGLDDDDLRDIIVLELGEAHCFRSKPTEKYYPETVSDYYSIWVDECGTRMFIKFLIANLGATDERLVVTSFKRDERYDR